MGATGTELAWPAEPGWLSENTLVPRASAGGGCPVPFCGRVCEGNVASELPMGLWLEPARGWPSTGGIHPHTAPPSHRLANSQDI